MSRGINNHTVRKLISKADRNINLIHSLLNDIDGHNTGNDNPIDIDDFAVDNAKVVEGNVRFVIDEIKRTLKQHKVYELQDERVRKQYEAKLNQQQLENDNG